MAVKKSDKCKQSFENSRDEAVGPLLDKTAKKLLGLRRELALLEHVSSVPKPSFRAAKELIKMAQQIFFPGFFAPIQVSEINIKHHTGQVLTCFYDLLSKEITAAIRHDCRRYNYECTDCNERGRDLALRVVEKLPALRKILALDVKATKEGDPAAGDHLDQIIFCYPGLFATQVYRLAHELHLLKVPFIPRIMTEYAHSKTGIDIHPGAEIGPSFFIDHGTGVVIGETTLIGRGVRIYQGVTLGALSLPKNAGAKLQGQKRHPTLEDEVIVYAGATILGGETVIGAQSVIGGNVWLTDSVPPQTKVLIKAPELLIVNHQRSGGRSKAAGRKGGQSTL